MTRDKGPGFIMAMYGGNRLITSAPKLTYSSGGNGYWICRTVRDGTVYQGVGATPREAYEAWLEVTRSNT